jgi:hypothetical protein
MHVLLSSLSGSDRTESSHYLRVLKRLGHEVFRFVVPAGDFNQEDGSFVEQGYDPFTSLRSIANEAGFEPDLFLYIEPNGLIPRGMEQAPFPTACILCDTHQDLNARLNLARFFDHVFLYHRNYLKYFNEHPAGHIHWHPYACDLALFHAKSGERDLDVAFVGKLMTRTTNRKVIIDRIRERWKVNEERFYKQVEIPEVYSRAKIVLNFPLADDLNFRTFEAMSCGALLLTRRVANGQEILFEENTHFVAFGGDQELFEKVDYYLLHPQEREKIANAGYAEIQKSHRLEQRLDLLFRAIQENPQRVAPIRHMKAPQVDRQYAWLYEYWHMLDPALSAIGLARRAGRPWFRLLIPALRTLARRLKNKR